MMKNLKSFNESSSTKVWMVIITDVGGFINEEESKCFLKKIDAANFYIKWINENYDTEFEIMSDDDGRYFTSVDENPDFEESMAFMDENYYQNGDIKIIETYLT